MDDTSIKIRLKIGEVEIEYEGNKTYLEQELVQLMEKVASCSNKLVNGILADQPKFATKGDDTPSGKPVVQMTVDTIAARLDAKTAADVTMAAIAYLALVEGRAQFSRSELLSCMKTAKNYYKLSMSKNLSGTISRLLKAKRINEITNGSYALPAAEKKVLEKKLANNI